MKTKTLLIAGSLFILLTVVGFQLLPLATVQRQPQSSVFEGYCFKCLFRDATRQVTDFKNLVVSTTSETLVEGGEQAQKFLGLPKFLKVCDRTPAVQNAILEQLHNKNCSQVTEKDLQTIDSIDIANKGVTSLKEGDLSGMHLRFFHAEHNNIEYLPPRFFAGQATLEGVFFDNNNLKKLPDEMGDDLHRVEMFSVYGNKDMQGFPKGFFANKEHIHEVDARNTRVTYGEIKRMREREEFSIHLVRRVKVGIDKRKWDHLNK